MNDTSSFAGSIQKQMEEEAAQWPLVAAVRAGDAAAVSKAIELGEDADACSPFDFRNPLALAFANDRNDLALILLDSGADPDASLGNRGPVSQLAARFPKAGQLTREEAMAKSLEALEMLKARNADLTLPVRVATASIEVGNLLEAAAEGRSPRVRQFHGSTF